MNPAIYEEINNPQKWRPRMGEPCAPETIAVFQKGLNRIFGTKGDGSPLVRIVWGQDFEKTKVFNRYSQEWYPAYFVQVNEWMEKDAAGQLSQHSEYACAPRYVVEGWRAPAIDYADLAMVETERVVVTDERGRPQTVTSDSFTRGAGDQWEELIRIVQHDHDDPKQSFCCQWNQAHENECWGYYRNPDNGDLKVLERGYKAMQQMFDTSPLEVRTPEEKARLFAARMDQVTKAKQYRRDQISRELNEFWASKFANPNQSITEQQHGPYHFLSGHRPSGSLNRLQG